MCKEWYLSKIFRKKNVGKAKKQRGCVTTTEVSCVNEKKRNEEKGNASIGKSDLQNGMTNMKWNGVKNYTM